MGAITTAVLCGESVTVTNVDELERRNIKEHGVTKPHDRTYSHKATKLHILSSSQERRASRTMLKYQRSPFDAA